MLLRVIICTFSVYQAVNANQGGLEAYEGNPSVDYFWTTTHQTLQHFIDVWNLNDPANVVSRETLQEIWYPIERSLKNEIGSSSWMRISNHFKDTLTHPQAAATLETLFSRIHRLLLRDTSKEVKDLYKGLDKKKEAWENLHGLKVLFMNTFFNIQEDPDMRRSLRVIINFLTEELRKNPEVESSSNSKNDKYSKNENRPNARNMKKNPKPVDEISIDTNLRI